MKIITETTLPDELITKEWLVEYLDKKFKELGTVVIPPPDPKPPVRDLPKCDEGPEIKWLKVLNNRQVQVNFHAKNVTEIEYSLYKGDKTIEVGKFKPKGNTPTIDFKEDLTFGTYTFKFSGVNCTGENTVTFDYRITLPPPVGGGTTKDTLETTFYYSK